MAIFPFVLLASGLYFTKLMAVSPIYFIFAICLLGLGLRFIVKGLPAYLDCLIFYVFLILVSFIALFNGSDLKITLNFVLSLLFFIVVRLTITPLSDRYVFKTIYVVLCIYALIFMIEALVRFYNPVFVTISGKDYRDLPGMLFYAYKLNSIMFADSNFTGINILCFSALLSFCISIGRREFKPLLLIYFVLVVLTLSRSAIVAFLFIYLVSYVLASKNKFLILCSFSAVALLVVTTILILDFMPSGPSDGSSASKLLMVASFLAIYPTFDWVSVFFGVGFGNGIDLLGVGTHIYPLTILLEGGLFMLITQFGVWLFLIFKAPRIMIILIPFSIASLSFASHANTVLYCCLAIGYHLDRSYNSKCGVKL